MQKYLIQFLMLGLFLFGTSASAQVLWTTQYVNASGCRSFAQPYGAEVFSQSVQGFVYPLQKGSGALFVHNTAAHLNAAALRRANDQALLNRLLTAANAAAFTKLDFGSAGGSSPSFVTTSIIKSTAYATAYLRSRNAISQTDLQAIDKWVGTLIKNSKVRAGSKDHKAAIIVSQLMWAAAKGDRRGVSRHAGKFKGYLGALKRQPYFIADLRNNNEVLQHVVHGAAILRLNGLDLFSPKIGKYSLDDAVNYHASQVIQNGSKKVITAGDPVEQARSIMRADGHGTHLAWIPVFLSTSSGAESRQSVLQLEKALRRIDGDAYWGQAMGIHTGCLFGR